MHTHVIDAKFGGNEIAWNRLGAGFEYGRPIWRMTGELNSNLDGSRRPGGIVTTRWRASDHLRLRGSFESQSNAVSFDARLAYVSGNRRALECVYRVNDGRSFDLTYSIIDFSDSNKRQTVKANWKERWDLGPRGRLSAMLEAHDTRNSLADAKYFNPADDTTVTGSTTFDWLYWREGKRSFSQRINLLAGSYSQHGYGAEPIWAGEYRHIVKLRAGLAMSYGVRRSLQPYDGKQSARNAGNLELTWTF